MTHAITDHALDNVRRDLVSKWRGTYPADEVETIFNEVVARHVKAATVTDFIPVLAEAETNERLAR
ncbi:hypothetical protein CAPI_08700 [Corynebacterium capitovis DSM 44611]|uniref:three-helix bundle dimerization domain-containing protein n=1 Tax=Corynebacterium capitovis TaxID=131081 RepID=UPI00037D7CAB|nr:hypothetical protein [Corynebacterium capitovis]WKD58266.1 hypothetical protein CAPI_08700 [Corynebacterium capitovis DSM 44611]